MQEVYWAKKNWYIKNGHVGGITVIIINSDTLITLQQ